MRSGTDIVTAWPESRRALAALQILFLVLMGAGVALARRYLDFHLGIPGHTGIAWMFFLVAARAMVSRKGAATVTGLSAGLWAIPVGLRHSFGYNLFLYSVVGLALDLVASLPKVRVRHPLGGALCGMLAHAAKFAFILGYAYSLGQATNFLYLGLFTSLGYHLFFGAAGGLLGALAAGALRPRLASGLRRGP